MPQGRQFDNATSQFGAFFSPTKEGARSYAGEKGHIYNANVSLKQPYEMPYGQFNYYQSPHKDAEGKFLPGEHWAARYAELKDEAAAHRGHLKSKGYDGIVVRNSKGHPIEISSFNDVKLS
jgi:hypothetical protein